MTLVSCHSPSFAILIQNRLDFVKNPDVISLYGRIKNDPLTKKTGKIYKIPDCGNSDN